MNLVNEALSGGTAFGVLHETNNSNVRILKATSCCGPVPYARIKKLKNSKMFKQRFPCGTQQFSTKKYT